MIYLFIPATTDKSHEINQEENSGISDVRH